MINRILEFLRPAADAGHSRRHRARPASACSRSSKFRSMPFLTSPTCRCRCSPPQAGCRHRKWKNLSRVRLKWRLGGLPRLTEMRSVSKIGLCAITVVFEDGVDDYFARQLVFERLPGAARQAARGRRCPAWPDHDRAWAKFSNTRSSARIQKYDATELRTVQDYIVRPILRTVPGVTDVNSFGGLVKQYQVIVKPDRLTSLRHHAAAGLRGAGEEQRQRQRQLHRAQIRAIRRARARAGEGHRRHREHHRRHARSTRRFTCAMWPT